MKRINFLGLILTLLVTAGAFSNVRAQETSPTDETNPNRAARPFRLLQELGLSPEQIQQIQRINQARRPIVQAAQQRWNEANANLDAAIYADNANEEQIKELTKTAQLAQAELLKEKRLTEYLIRKVLTPEQLVKFRELRERVRERMNERKNINKQERQQTRPLNRFQRRNQNRQP